MPLSLEGYVVLRINDGSRENLRVDAAEFVYKEGGMRILGDQCTQHEFLYTYEDDPRFELALTATALNGEIEGSSLVIDARGNVEVEEEENSLVVRFEHDPDQDDEPLTPVSSN
ncbi:hypothetical protein [Billgrantia bachuensis]|uniref:Uncharacterized protein n=1 Tax=Billgrantia bachuensis TaxID=2717286 RepID=A0ABX0PN54_9GAMM|nr:hypothetical protein [Halomonas bachuensis]NIC04701.1 hypothetical protein [Halomonas bachuensis]